MPSSKINNHDLDEQVKKQLYEYTDIPMISTKDETCSELDAISNSMPNGCYYRRYIYHDVSHPIIGGGNKYLEGFKSSSMYEWQICTTYAENGAFSWRRSKINGTWTAWSPTYLPLTGGNVSGPVNLNQLRINGGPQSYIQYMNNWVTHGYLGFEGTNNPVFINADANKIFKLFGEHNKPSGSYTGNGSATARMINTGGIVSNSRMVLVCCGNLGTNVLLTRNGPLCWDSSIKILSFSEGSFDPSGNIKIASTSVQLNKSGEIYDYYVL